MNLRTTIILIALLCVFFVKGIDILRVIKHSFGYVELGYVIYLQKMNKINSFDNDTLSHETIIAHAGGHVDSLTYTNTLEAMNDSYNRGIRFYELDFEWTSDNKLVCIHDWDQTWNKYYLQGIQIPNWKTFLQTKMINNMKQMDINILATWMKSHKDCYVITDVKRNNITALEIIKNEYPGIINNIIPQIYWFYEYKNVIDLGYERVILTLYKSNYWDSQVVLFTKHYKVFAVTMPRERAVTKLPSILLIQGIFVYMHTTNSSEEYLKLMKNGVSGIYSDIL